MPHMVEYRAGLVLYGGVSLAVYIGGVAAEFLAAVRAGHDTDPLDQPYRELLDALDGRLTVDVIAGSSAGGINGVFLARALATGGRLDELGDLWRLKGDMGPLLDWRGERAPAESLLNGEYFLRELEAALERIRGPSPSSDEARAPLTPALDLFITGTDLGGRLWEREDALGNRILGREHAMTFHLKVRQRYCLTGQAETGYNCNDLAGASPEEDRSVRAWLARICRTTSAVPAAFTPVPFQSGEVYGSDPHGPRQIWLADGGILQNQPFEPLLRTVFNRAADRPVERMLFYVEPSLTDPEPPGPVSSGAAGGDHPKPNAYETLRAALQLPLAQSISRHLQAIEQHNQRVGQARTMTQVLEQHLQGPSTASAPAQTGPAFAAYLALRQSQVAAALKARLPAGELHRATAAPDFLERYDLDFEHRRITYLIEWWGRLHRELPAGLRPEERDRIAPQWAAWQERMAVHEARFWTALEHLKDLQWHWSQAPTLHGLAGALRIWREQHAAMPVDMALAQEPAAWLPERLRWSPPDLRQAWEAYALRDMLLLPLATGSSLGERAQIDWIRISPYDADSLLQADPNRPEPIAPGERTRFGAGKLAGNSLANFSGFLSWRWRANDHMWGRLDAADLILRSLVKQAEASGRYDSRRLEAIKELAQRCRLQRFREILKAELLPEDQERLLDTLLTSLGEDPGAIEERLARQSAAGRMAGGSAPLDAAQFRQALQAAGTPLDPLLDLLTWEEIRQFLTEEYRTGRETVASLHHGVMIHTLLDLAENGRRVVERMVRQARRPLPWLIVQAGRVAGWSVQVVRFLLRPFIRRPRPGEDDRARGH